MTKIPAGLTSSVTANNKSFILQTEFVASPANHDGLEGVESLSSLIKTTVAVEGQVVHKVEKAFAGPIDTEEAFIDAEKAVKQQHISVARIVSSKPREFIANVSELTISAEDRLGVIPGIAEVLKVDLANPAAAPIQSGSGKQFTEKIEPIRDLVLAVSQNTRLGKLKKLVGAIEDKKFMLIGYGGSTYFLGLAGDADVSSIFQELDKVRA
jgi:hypothetical protein